MAAGIVAVSTVLTVGCEQQKPEGANYSFDCALPGNPESLDPQFTSDENSMTVIGNLFTGLMKTDDTGKLENAVAKDYTISADGLKYTFTLRTDCYWFFDADEDEETDDNELTPVTAHDFEFAFKRIFNPETCSPHKEKYECLKNAGDIISGSADYTELGVKALSDTELVFELEYPNVEFLNALTFTAAMPCNEQFFYDTKGRYGLDDKSVASNGVRSHKGTVSILREVLMSRSVKNIYAEAVILKLKYRRGNGNTSLLFNFHPVGNGVSV